jgi:hypothetical protein
VDDVPFGYRLFGAFIVLLIAGVWANVQGIRAPWLLSAFAVFVLAPSDRWRGSTAARAVADGVFVGLFAGVLLSAAFGASIIQAIGGGAALGAVLMAGELWFTRAAR